MKWKWQLALFSLAHIIIFFFLFHSGLYDDRYSSTDMYFDYASSITAGKLPYRDFPLEYPPLALIFLLVPRLVASRLSTYIIAFRIEILVFDLLAMLVISIMARKLKVSHWSSLAIFTAFLLANGPITDQRYDLVPAFIVLLALYTFYQGKQKTSWAILAIATMTKLYPAVIAPIFLLSDFLSHRYRRMLINSSVFALIIVLTAIPCFLLSLDGFIDMFTYHARRGIQFESTYSSLLMLAHRLDLIRVNMELTYGSWNLAGAAPDMLAKLASPLLLVFLAFIYWSFYRKCAVMPGHSALVQPEQAGLIINHSLAAVLVFMVAGKVFSPQYILWAYPLLPLVTGPQKYFSWILYLASGLMTLYIWPAHYTDFFGFDMKIIMVLLGRNILLVAVATVLSWHVVNRRPGKAFSGQL